MQKQLTCQSGHRWEITTGNDALDVIEGTVCPSCGAAAMTVELGDTSPRETVPPAGAPIVPGYQVLDELGRGGMGVVYRAWHRSLKRQVALKMIQPGGEVRVGDLRRFRTEAEAGAALQHPNIVQIFDVGEVRDALDRPCPYLTLEYVAGGTLARHLAGVPQPPGPAAELVETLARAMQHAHERGVVHRDLKPANILMVSGGVASGEWSPNTTHHSPLTTHQPKITDFGLAKQLDGDLGQTQSGAVLGTPSYMAPEQANGQRETVGPHSDIYGLGAILYELLTGRPPFRGTSVLETLDQVRHQDPVPPSRLQPKVPRDLETITLKCLQKEPARRYPSALDLAEDLRRFRNGEPIQARPVGPGERLWRWCRRNPALAGLAAALLITLILANVVVVALWRHAEHQRSLAVQNLRDARQAVHDHFVLLSETRLPNQPGTQALQKQLWEAARAYFTRFAEQDDNDPTLQADAAEAHYRIGLIERQLGAADRALEAVQQAENIYTRLAKAAPSDARTLRYLGSCFNLDGTLQTEMGRFPEAVAAYQQAQSWYDKLLQEQGLDQAWQRDAAKVRYNLGVLRYRMNRSAEALADYQAALNLFQMLASKAVLTDDQPAKDLAQCYNSLGVLYKEQLDQPDEALRWYQQALTPRKILARSHPSIPDYQEDLADTYNNLAVLHLDLTHQFDEARQAFQQALTLRDQLARASPDAIVHQLNLADTQTNLGILHAKTGARAEALHSLEQALAVRERLARAHPASLRLQRLWATIYHNLGLLHADLGQKVEAVRYHQQALDLRLRLAREHPTDPNLPEEVRTSQCELNRQ
jgi:serine/threonine protein kinase